MGFKLRDGEKVKEDNKKADANYHDRRKQIVNIMLKYKQGDQLPHIDYYPQQTKFWTETYKKLRKYHDIYMVQRYRACIDKMQAKLKLSQKVPQIAELSDYLQGLTGFKVRPTHGILNGRDFLNAFAFKICFSTQFIRNRSNLEFCQESDFVHECIGHLPLLADKQYADVIHKIGLYSLGASDQDLDRLSKIFWYLVEFGACKQNGKMKAFGAGIASSIDEMENMKTARFQKIRPQKDCYIEYDDSKVLETYRTTDSFEEALQILNDFGKKMPKPIITSYDYRSNIIHYDRSIQAIQSLS